MKNSTLNIQVATAVFMLIGGLALAVAGFIVPPLGQIHESVLGIFAECLIYAGSIFGVTVYIRTKYTEMKTYLDESLKKNEECGMWNEEWSAEPMKNEEWRNSTLNHSTSPKATIQHSTFNIQHLTFNI